MKTKAAILHTTGEALSLEEVDIPTLKEGQYLIKIHYTSLCGSQLNEIYGKKGKDEYLPHLLGHEAIGTVVDKHVSCEKINLDQKVIRSWINGGGLNGGPVKYGKYNAGPIATFTEYAVISENKLHEINVSQALPIHSVLGCAVPTAAGAVQKIVRLADVLNKDVLVIGAGAVGLSILIYLFGKCNLYVKDVNESKIQEALKYSDLHCGQKVDLVFDCTGSISSLNKALDFLKQGTLVIVGNTPYGEKMEVNPWDFIFGKKIIGHNGNDIEMQKFVKNISKTDLNQYNNIIGDQYCLDDINKALLSTKKPIISC